MLPNCSRRDMAYSFWSLVLVVWALGPNQQKILLLKIPTIQMTPYLPL